jgi:hypothetical protein
MLYLGTSMTAVGVTLGIFFSIKVLLWALLFCSLLSLGWAAIGAHNQMMTTVVTVVTLQIGYFIGMIIRTVLDVSGWRSLRPARSNYPPHSKPFRPSRRAPRRNTADGPSKTEPRNPPAPHP